MLLSEILQKYDNGTLANESDASLLNAQSAINLLVSGLTSIQNATFRVTGFNKPVTKSRLLKIADFLTKTLNTRYGCND
ncbi:hypothetical protein [Larkinella sp. C7]|jgi:hypothetical protein|uniref:hypothetical protein n=1 Tax=Larkinella sp. C7 TaxID=2576607 RepID=UPI0011115C62|nr:hypothetical protein [Larkinella sp. C7]